MNKKQENIKKFIAVGIGIIVVVPFVFGGQFFSRMFPFSLFQLGSTDINKVENVTSQDGDDTGTPAVFSDPITILDLEVGEGAVAEAGKVVQVGYIGTRIDPETGQEIIFDQNTNREAPFTFPLGANPRQVIEGFEVGVTGMRVGGKRLVIIQPEAGYGSQQAGDIPPNTTLQFVIELYDAQ